VKKTISPIAFIRTDFKEKFGIPRQSGRAKNLLGEIVFEKPFRNPDALRELNGFSHLWLVFGFSETPYTSFSPTVRPPRLGGNKKVGVFASRSPFRPNGLGLSCVKLEEIKPTEKNGLTLIVSGVDLLDGTPIYDIKPYVPMCDCVESAKGGYTEETKKHFLTVDFPEKLLCLLPENKRTGAVEVLKDDPRPSYQEDGRLYTMSYAGFDLSFSVSGDTLTVTDVKIL
jgi:tRNA-Thr(GGU) m(6)t(6)A37 methyltransferase TsaA